MADLNVNLKQSVSPKVLQRTLLLGRMKMAQAIQMPEREWAKVLSDIERDPLFRKLISSPGGKSSQIIRYRRFKRGAISSQFYDAQDVNVAGGSGESPEALLMKKKDVLRLIKVIGQDKFEKYFLYREEALPLEDIAKACGLALQDAEKINGFILDMSVHSEFYHPSTLDRPDLVKPTMVGKIVRNSDDGQYSVAFFSPHMARGRYEIDHDKLKQWQKGMKLSRDEAARLRKFVGLLELSNLKQGAFWRVIEYLLVLHKEYFDTQDPSKMAPVSLRKVAKHLQFAPSTISRVMGNKSIMLPWDREAAILDLMPGQRTVVLAILEKVLTETKETFTDSALAKMLKEKYLVAVSRRTVTACRHIIEGRKKAQKA